MDKQQRILDFTRKTTLERLKQLNIDHDQLFDVLRPYGGVISGSFMFVNLRGLPLSKCNDIDIFVQDLSFDNDTATVSE